MNTRTNQGFERILISLQEQFTQRCRIQAPDTTPDSRTGQQGVKKGLYIDLPGHVDIACIRASVSPFKTGPGIAETKLGSMTQDVSYFQILLFGFYPEITAAMRCVIDSDIARFADGSVQFNPLDYPEKHDILGVESDSKNTMTRLKTQILVA